MAPQTKTKLNQKRGIHVAIAKSGLSPLEFRNALGISNNMTFWNWRNKGNLTLKQACQIADVASIDIQELIDDMRE